MQGNSTLPYHISVTNDHDVIVLRQEVRRVARELGVGLVRQAKIATAISAVARALLARHAKAIFTIQLASQSAQPALELVCAPPLRYVVLDREQIERALHFEDVRLLVDEADLVVDTDWTQLTLRIWLEH